MKLITIVILAAILLVSCTAEEAADFTLKSTDNEVFTLSQTEGPIYIKFWASWCPVCLDGLEEINMLNDERIITIVSPGVSGEMDADDFTMWFERLDYDNMRVFLDIGGNVAKKYGVRYYPTSVFIDENGNVIETIPGHIDNNTILERIDDI